MLMTNILKALINSDLDDPTFAIFVCFRFAILYSAVRMHETQVVDLFMNQLIITCTIADMWHLI